MLFSEYRIRNHTAKNRIVRSATNEHLGEMDGGITREMIDLYEQLAIGGSGTIITGHFGVNERYRAKPNQPLLTDDCFIPEAAAMAEVAHRHGSVIYGQISQGGLMAHAEPFDINTATHDQLKLIPEEFAAAALRLKTAGYDGVQIHMAHGYFLSNVLDDTVNLRTDEYGCNPEGRFRLIGEVLSAVREAIGTELDLLVKISANNTQKLPYIDTLLYYVRALKAAGVDAIELSGNDFREKEAHERAYYLPEALAVKKAVDMPLILVGGLRDRRGMEAALAKGIDMIALSRPLICEPDLPNKMKTGQESSICLGCFGCMKLFNTQYKNCVFLPPSQQLQKTYAP